MVNKKSDSTTKGIVPKILVLCEDKEASKLLAINLQRTRFDIVVQNDFEQAVTAWENEVPDMVLIDVKGFDVRLVDFVARLRREMIIPILLLAHTLSDEQIIEMYLAGVDDCILEPVKPTLVILKMQAWLRRTWTLSIDAMDEFQVGKFALVFSERILKINSQWQTRLTNLELRLLHVLMSNSGRAITHDEIIQRVWGYQSNADYAALKNIVYRLRRKIEPDPMQPKYLLTLPGIGYKFTARTD